MKTFGFLTRHALFYCALLSALLLWSCQSEPDPVDSTLPSVSKIYPTDPAYKYILSLGFDERDIVDLGNSYVVEGDIEFEKNLFSNQGAKLSHAIQSILSFVSYGTSQGTSGNITVRLDNNFADSYDRTKVRTALVNAMNHWNGISNSNLQFSLTSSTSQDIFVTRDNTIIPGGYDARGTYPVNCTAGATVRVAQTAIDLDADKLEFIMTHELGHTIGFLHTDESGGVSIPGTPLTETGSVMNSKSAYGGITPAWSNFTSGDLTATRFLYPSSANATAIYDPVTEKIVVHWTTTYFCNSNITIDVYGGTSSTPVKSSNGANNGTFYFDTNDLTAGVDYEFQVHATGSPTPFLYDTESF